MSRFDRRRGGVRGAMATSATIALFALVAGADESTPADAHPGGVSSVEAQALETRPADGLGASRLFFTAEQRHAMTLGEPGGSRQPSDSTGEARDGKREPDAAPDRRTTVPARTADSDDAAETDRTGSARSRESASRVIAFQALLNADGQAQVVFGGGLCRAERAANGRAGSGAVPLALRCAAMPAGVRAVTLLRQERRLLIGLSGGGHRHLALGESVALP